MNQLIQKLQEAQTERQMNDSEFAKFLGISSTSWCRIQKGTRSVSVLAITGILFHLPELKPQLETYLKQKKNAC